MKKITEVIDSRMRQAMQEDCVHDWKEVQRYRDMDDSMFDPDFDNYVDIYCPVCRAEKNRLSEVYADRLLKQSQINQEYLTRIFE